MLVPPWQGAIWPWVVLVSVWFTKADVTEPVAGLTWVGAGMDRCANTPFISLSHRRRALWSGQGITGTLVCSVVRRQRHQSGERSVCCSCGAWKPGRQRRIPHRGGQDCGGKSQGQSQGCLLHVDKLRLGGLNKSNEQSFYIHLVLLMWTLKHDCFSLMVFLYSVENQEMQKKFRKEIRIFLTATTYK